MQGSPPQNPVSGQNRQKTSQPEPVTLDLCRDDHSLLSVTKCIIDLCFHPSTLCSQPVHHHFQYSTFALAPLALKLIIKCTASTLKLALTLARLALMPTKKYSHYTEANTQACTLSIETHQIHTEASTKT